MGLVVLPAWGGDGITLVGPDGKESVLRPADGEMLLLHFWATWCPSCAEDIDNLQRAAGGCPALRVITVNVGEGESDVAEFVAEHGVRLPVLRDPKGRVWRDVDGRGLPMNLFWTQQTRRTGVGPKTLEEWRREFASFGCEGPSDAEERPDPDSDESQARDPGEHARIQVLGYEGARDDAEQ